METSFIELRCKEVVNVLDGRKLGHICDVVFDLGSARVLGFVLPGEKKGWNFLRSGEQIFLPFNCIVKIGEDAILVELCASPQPQNPYILSQNTNKKE